MSTTESTKELSSATQGRETVRVMSFTKPDRYGICQAFEFAIYNPDRLPDQVAMDRLWDSRVLVKASCMSCSPIPSGRDGSAFEAAAAA